MIVQYSLYSAILMVSAIISGLLAGYVWRHRAAPGGVYFSLLMAAASWWSLFNALEILVSGSWLDYVCYKILYLGVVAVSPLWLLFTLEYTRHSGWMTAGRKVLLWAIPVLSLPLVATNWQELVWSSITPVSDALGYRLVYEHGIVDLIIAGYSYVLIAAGFTVLLITAVHAARPYRGQIWTLLLGVMVPWGGSMIYLSNGSPFPGLDLTPFALMITGGIYAWGIFRQHLFDIVPVARETLITKMVDGVLVLDDQNRVVDLNPAAREMVGASRLAIGMPAAAVLKRWPDLEIHCADGVEKTVEIHLGDEGETRWLEARISPLRDRYGQPTGLLIIMRDITERKRSEEALHLAYDELIRSNDALQAEVTERRKAEGIIRASLTEKEVLLKEIHHRVKNNMQIISSLLNLQSYNVSKESATAFKESQNRIKSMALIHEKLYQSHDLSRINFAEYANSLAAYLARSYAVNPGVKVSVDVENVLLDIDRAIPCGLIINELVSNSLKYAFKDGRQGTIEVRLSAGNGGYVLEVGDDGVGIPPGLDYLNTGSLGLQLVYTLAEQIGGTIELLPGAGTRFRVSFPIAEAVRGER